MKVSDCMSPDVRIASPGWSIRDAARAMKEIDAGFLPVGEHDRLVGMVTDRDITIRAVAEGRDPGATSVSEVMTRNVVTVTEDQDLQEAEKLMHDHQIRRLPVTDANLDLIGYLALAKIARTADESRGGKVLKGISEPSKPPPMEAAPRKKRKRKTG